MVRPTRFCSKIQLSLRNLKVSITALLSLWSWLQPRLGGLRHALRSALVSHVPVWFGIDFEDEWPALKTNQGGDGARRQASDLGGNLSANHHRKPSLSWCAQ